MDFASYLLLGLATSLHCVAMCGTLVMTYSVKGGAERGLVRRVAPHLAYQGSKILSYMAVAVVLGSAASLLGSAIDITSFRDWVMVFAGGFMVLLGLSMTGYFPWLTKLTPGAPAWLTRLLSSNRKRAMREASTGKVPLATPVTFGLLTGLMPCAPLIAAQAGAMSQASPLQGALLMFAFGLGTAPLMVLVGLVSGLLGANFRKRMQVIAAAAVLIFGLIILDRGLVLVGSPVSFQAVKRTVVGSAGTAAVSASADGTGTVRFDLVIENTRFVPDVVSLPADRPIELVVDRREGGGCSDQLAIPQLGILVDLKPFGETTIDLPPTKAGSYTLTCGMGMMSGTVVFGEGGAGGSGSPTTLLAAGMSLAAAVGVLVFALRRRRKASAAGGAKAAGGTVLGFTWLEALLIVSAVAAATFAGLSFGGLIRP